MDINTYDVRNDPANILQDLANAATTQDRVVALNKLLEVARDAYYKKASPIMPDAEYDAYERQLKEILKKYPSLASYAPAVSTVGSDLKDGSRIKHAIPMKSIENMYTEDDYLSWYDAKAMDGNNVVVQEPKFDGISVSLVYKNGKLIRALTRGDGESGEDITEAVYKIESIPVTLRAVLPDLEVRGELVMKNSTLARINEGLKKAGQKTYASTRNLVAGTVKLKDLSLIPDREIQIRPWDVMTSSKTMPVSRLERLQMLVPDGFPVPLGTVCKNRNEVLTVLRRKLEERETVLRAKHSLETDGVVIKIDDTAACAELGYGSNYTNYQTCFKPQSASGTTYVRGVSWQIGRTGKLTPVADCDPVVLAGAEVRRANLNNISYIREMGLSIGAKIEMLRSGDVIPQIVRVIEDGPTPIVVPTNCPECYTKLEVLDEERTGVETSWCPNAACPGRVRDMFAFIGDRDILEIDGLGPEMATKLAAEGYARTVGELFTFQTEAIAGFEKIGSERFAAAMTKKGFSGAMVVRMVNSMEIAKNASWDRWIACLGIPMVSKSLGKIIAQTMKLTPESMKDLPTVLKTFASMDIAGMGFRKKELIREWLANPRNVQMCQELYAAGVRPKPLVTAVVGNAGTPLAGIAFCITGEMLEMDRDKLSSVLESLGAVKKSGVSKNCTHLIRLDAPGKSKVAAAEKLGIPIVDKDWVKQQLAKGGINLENDKFPIDEEA